MGKKKRVAGSGAVPALPAEGQRPEAAATVAARLGQVLGLACIVLLPLASGGYSGWGYQFGFVLLPLAALLCLPSLRLSRLAGLVLAALFIAAAIFLWPTGPAVHAGVLLWYSMLALISAWIVAQSVFQHSPDIARWIFPAITVSAVLTAFAGLFPWWGHYLNAGDFDYYVVSTFGLHNPYAGFLLLAWPAAAIAALQARGWARRLLWACCGLLIVTLFLTLSKASIAVFLLQSFVLLVVGVLRSSGRRRLWPALAGGGVLLVIAFALPAVRAALWKLSELDSYSMQGRLRFWEAALQMFTDHPLTGVGLGNFRYVFPQYQRDWLFYSVDPHSWALQLLAELGIWGGLIALAVLVGCISWAIKTVRAELASARNVAVSDTADFTAADEDKHRPYVGSSSASLLAMLAVGGSLLHALLDFDYTFAATTALFGVLLAFGSSRHGAAAFAIAHSETRFGLLHDLTRLTSTRALKLIAGLGLIAYLILGQQLTLERHVLDQLRADLPPERKVDLLRQTISFIPFNESTQLQLAEQLAWQQGKQSQGGYGAATHAWRHAPRNSGAHALLAALEQDPARADERFQRAIELDPYNHPEYYYAWAQAAQTPEQRYERLKLGVERIPAEHPITRAHARAPDWFGLNPLWAKWWTQLAELEDDPVEKRRYEEIAARFKAALTPPAPAPTPAESGVPAAPAD